MKRATRLSEIAYDKNSVVTVGSFDGMHRAHQEIICEVVQRAQRRGGRSVLVTFEPHPREVVGTHQGVQLLTTLEEKQELAEEQGIDLFFTIAFDYEFSRQSAREFYLKYLINGIGMSEIVEGYDHHFGRDREGSVEEMLRLGKEFGYSSVAVKEVSAGDRLANSTSIRDLLIDGDVVEGAKLLDRPYSIDGKVVKGDMRGRALGFPTANIQPLAQKKLIPKNGIYFVRVRVDGGWHFGIASIGVRPTFETKGDRVIEVYILNYQEVIYGHEIRLVFLQRLRDEVRFENADQLIRQMNMDKEESIRLRSEYIHQNNS
jgi:riboflavin kinase/FMN adenylyltransferase